MCAILRLQGFSSTVGRSLLQTSTSTSFLHLKMAIRYDATMLTRLSSCCIVTSSPSAFSFSWFDVDRGNEISAVTSKRPQRYSVSLRTLIMMMRGLHPTPLPRAQFFEWNGEQLTSVRPSLVSKRTVVEKAIISAIHPDCNGVTTSPWLTWEKV